VGSNELSRLTIQSILSLRHLCSYRYVCRRGTMSQDMRRLVAADLLHGGTGQAASRPASTRFAASLKTL